MCACVCVCAYIIPGGGCVKHIAAPTTHLHIHVYEYLYTHKITKAACGVRRHYITTSLSTQFNGVNILFFFRVTTTTNLIKVVACPAGIYANFFYSKLFIYTLPCSIRVFFLKVKFILTNNMYLIK